RLRYAAASFAVIQGESDAITPPPARASGAAVHRASDATPRPPPARTAGHRRPSSSQATVQSAPIDALIAPTRPAGGQLPMSGRAPKHDVPYTMYHRPAIREVEGRFRRFSDRS